MTVVILGIPSAFTAWTFAAALRIAQTRDPAVQPLWVDRHDGFELDGPNQALVCAQYPSRPLRDALSMRPIPVVLITTSATDAVSFQRQAQPALLEAVRTIGASLALIGDCRPSGPVLRLEGSSSPPASAILSALADHMGIELYGEAASALLEALGPVPAVPMGTLVEADEAIITLVLENSVAHLRDAAVPIKAIWPHRVFFSGDRPNEEAPLVADATGGSRVLYYGPYFHLAEGKWRAKLTLGFTKEAVGLPLKISAWGPGLLGEARFRPRQEGIYAAPFSFTVAEPEHPVELHIRTEEGAIEGRIALGQVELNHVGLG
ncbi:hypothetical protein [Bosea sp. (in: a-proteobacteria)]|uniref:hypothetical protein n=1 Tax=Bosea sp. (in: a-proteobacteria) TaxID=1871050 RepID=UPI003F6FD02E